MPEIGLGHQGLALQHDVETRMQVYRQRQPGRFSALSQLPTCAPNMSHFAKRSDNVSVISRVIHHGYTSANRNGLSCSDHQEDDGATTNAGTLTMMYAS
jgi:hypothetical protein